MVVPDLSNEEDKQTEATPLEDTDLRAIVTRQEKMVEHLCHQTTALTKVIATAILSPEQVMTILQSEEGVGKEAEAIGGGDEEGVMEVEPEALGAREKARPIY